MGAVALWAVLALFMGINSWEEGKEDAYQSGDRKQNLESIEEQLARERNLRRAPHIILPELGDLPREYEQGHDRGYGREPSYEYGQEYRQRRTYLGSENALSERAPSSSLLRPDSPLERESSPQPYISDRRSPAYLGESSSRPAYYGAESSPYLPAGRRSPSPEEALQLLFPFCQSTRV